MRPVVDRIKGREIRIRDGVFEARFGSDARKRDFAGIAEAANFVVTLHFTRGETVAAFEEGRRELRVLLRVIMRSVCETAICEHPPVAGALFEPWPPKLDEFFFCDPRIEEVCVLEHQPRRR